jgi:hypothetical protein
LAEGACGTTAAWAVDGAVRHPEGDKEGAAAYACCRHDRTVLRGSISYARALRPRGSYSRAACSFDAKLKAQTAHRCYRGRERRGGRSPF